MSDSNDRERHSKRLHQEQTAVNRQLKIAKQHGLGEKFEDQPHRLAKHHAMDCGNPQCPLCGNPRRTHKDPLTAQEKRQQQDLDNITDRGSNGLPDSTE
jgi:hypothetical protein